MLMFTHVLIKKIHIIFIHFLIHIMCISYLHYLWLKLISELRGWLIWSPDDLPCGMPDLNPIDCCGEALSQPSLYFQKITKLMLVLLNYQPRNSSIQTLDLSQKAEKGIIWIIGGRWWYLLQERIIFVLSVLSYTNRSSGWSCKFYQSLFEKSWRY